MIKRIIIPSLLIAACNQNTSALETVNPKHYSVLNQKDSIETKIKVIVGKTLGISFNLIQLQSHFTHDLGADSLDVVEIIMNIEKEYGLSIPDDKAEQIQTVEMAINYVLSILKIN